MQAGHTTRLRIGIASLVALAVAVTMAAFGAGAAKAGDNGGFTTFDPQQINVPYLAWRGEEVRLMKCFPGLPPGQGGASGAPAGKFIVEDWSGDPHFQPQMANGLANTTTWIDGTGDQEGRTCFSGDFLSQKAGLAIIKLKVHYSELIGGGEDQVIAEHQFLVGWMRIASANVEDIGPTTVPASRAAINYWVPNNDVAQTVVGKCNIQVGGGVITGNCPTVASPATTAASQNQIQITITGEIPMENNFDEVNAQLGRAPGTPLVMPRDWAALAGVMARSSLAGYERSPELWDIHDEFTGVPGGAVAPPAGHGTGWTPAQPNLNAGPTHQSGGICAGSSTTMDEVDNCLGGGEFGAPVDADPTSVDQDPTEGGFSRFLHPWVYGNFSDMTDITIGPYDPLREDTYLPNGTLDEGDAPMPTARVDFNLNGVGMLLPIDKHVVYSRNGAGGETLVDPDPTVPGDEFIDYPGNAHNLWAPFYGRWIPSTQARDGASTTTSGTNLPWTVEPTSASGEDGGAANDFHSYLARGVYHYWDFVVALERTGALSDCPPFTPGIPASDAFGIIQAAVYTDEHGEARVGFNGGIGFPFGLTPNENGACDLQAAGIDPGDTLGTATITAIARYPHQPVTVPDVPGDEVVTKTVTSLFAKTLTCVRKTAEITEAVWICTATATGIDGTPFPNELVCFFTPVGGILRPFPEGTILYPAPGFDTVFPNLACVYTNSDGVAQIEVIGKGQFNVEAEFTDENIFRRFDISGSPLSGTTGGNPGTGGVGGTGGTPTTPPASPPPASNVPPSLGNTGNVNRPTANRPAIQARVMSARLIETKSGRKLALRIKSAKKVAKVRIVLKNRQGKVLATAVRSVRTNRVVTVPNLRIARGAVRISVRVLS